jgi:hypothetical protein
MDGGKEFLAGHFPISACTYTKNVSCGRLLFWALHIQEEYSTS